MAETDVQTAHPSPKQLYISSRLLGTDYNRDLGRRYIILLFFPFIEPFEDEQNILHSIYDDALTELVNHYAN